MKIHSTAPRMLSCWLCRHSLWYRCSGSGLCLQCQVLRAFSTEVERVTGRQALGKTLHCRLRVGRSGHVLLSEVCHHGAESGACTKTSWVRGSGFACWCEPCTEVIYLLDNNGFIFQVCVKGLCWKGFSQCIDNYLFYFYCVFPCREFFLHFSFSPILLCGWTCKQPTPNALKKPERKIQTKCTKIM